MKKYLEGKIQIVENLSSWEEAVRLGAKPLLEKRIIEERYVGAMIENIKNLGMYIILSDGVAMPHARPEAGVIDTGLSLLVIKEGVVFDPEEPKIKLVFVLAAKDNSSHIDIIKNLSDIIDDEELIEEIANKETIEEILEMLD